MRGLGCLCPYTKKTVASDGKMPMIGQEESICLAQKHIFEWARVFDLGIYMGDIWNGVVWVSQHDAIGRLKFYRFSIAIMRVPGVFHNKRIPVKSSGKAGQFVARFEICRGCRYCKSV